MIRVEFFCTVSDSYCSLGFNGAHNRGADSMGQCEDSAIDSVGIFVQLGILHCIFWYHSQHVTIYFFNIDTDIEIEI